ncbi:MAG TPA: 3-dehydroquinate synthase [Gemmatimonadaceae bacterium]|jgi:3-dehydroquinate synthase|nr:3-dehydroquinate synthase [Gemmatimonadaceae bacterium]
MATNIDPEPERAQARVIDAGDYRVIVSAGLRHDFASHIADSAPAHHYAIVSDAEVAPLYAEPLVLALAAHAPVSVHVIPSGEAHKTRDTWARVTDGLLDAGCGRDTTVVALGGGVVGDLAGFVAATFMRGVPVVQCPTTLLAMIDASIGGKTGVDTAAGKNLVGAFHAPAAVLADVEMARTLPLAQRRSGLVEAIKHGVLADAAYFARIDALLAELLDAEPAATLDVVARSVEIKADVVRADTREHGLRKTLNLGHTIGHAIEHVSGYALLHGECVAIGMVLESRIAERLGVADAGTTSRITEVLQRAGLPTERPRDLSVDAIVDATRLDKKARGGRVEYSLPARIGAMAGGDSGWALPVDDQLVHEVLA